MLALSPEGGSTDSSTHWLMACEHESECGELSCVCGACSASCREVIDQLRSCAT